MTASAQEYNVQFRPPAAAAGAAAQIISAGTEATNQPTTGTNYFSITSTGSMGTSATQSDRQVRFPAAGSLSDMRIELSTAPTSSHSYTYTVVKNESTDTALSCAVSGASTTCTDSDSVSFAAGDRASLKVVVAGTPAASYPYWTFKWTPDTADEFIILGAAPAPGSSTSRSVFAFGTGGQDLDGSKDDRTCLVATAGTVSNLYVQVDAAVGAGKTRTIQVYKNGVAAGSPGNMECTISGASQTQCSDTANSITFAAGDRLLIRNEETSGSPPAVALATGIMFDPDTAGKWIGCGVSDNTTHTSTPEYGDLHSSDWTWDGTESNNRVMSQAFTMTDFRVRLATDPSTGSYLVTVQVDASAGLSCTVSAGSTTCSTSGSDAVSNDSKISVELDGSAATTSAWSQFGYAGTVP